MSDYATPVRQPAPSLDSSQASSPTTAAPASSATSSNSAVQAGIPGTSDAQKELDQAAAAEAGMSDAHVATLASFGLRPSEMDVEAGKRMATGLDRMEAHLADAGSGGLVINDPEFTLSVTVTPNSETGLPERRMLFSDADGTVLSGVAPVTSDQTAPLHADAQIGDQPIVADDAPVAKTSALDSALQLAEDGAAMAELLAWSVAGAGAQFMSNDMLGAADPLLDRVDVESFQDGRTAGDVISFVAGGMEMMAGAGIVGLSVGVTTPMAGLVGLASGGMLAVPAAGAAATVDALGLALGGGFLLQGGMMMASAAKGLQEGQRGDWKYQPAPNTLEAFPEAKRGTRKTPKQGGGLRERWVDGDGTIYEWDYQHGTVEKYNKRGKHLGEYDAKTGAETKPADKTRYVEP